MIATDNVCRAGTPRSTTIKVPMPDAHQRPAARVLVIDDDAASLQLFQHMLEDEGYSVRVALTVEAGLRETERHHPAAILLDLHLPVTDGLECLRRLRAGHLTVPVAILTGDYFIDDEVARALHALGARIHFKPVWDTDLSRIVKALVTDRAE